MSITNFSLVRLVEEIKQIDETIEIEQEDNVITVINYNTNIDNYISYLLLLFGKVIIK